MISFEKDYFQSSYIFFSFEINFRKERHRKQSYNKVATLNLIYLISILKKNEVNSILITKHMTLKIFYVYCAIKEKL